MVLHLAAVQCVGVCGVSHLVSVYKHLTILRAQLVSVYLAVCGKPIYTVGWAKNALFACNVGKFTDKFGASADVP